MAIRKVSMSFSLIALASIIRPICKRRWRFPWAPRSLAWLSSAPPIDHHSDSWRNRRRRNDHVRVFPWAWSVSMIRQDRPVVEQRGTVAKDRSNAWWKNSHRDLCLCSSWPRPLCQRTKRNTFLFIECVFQMKNRSIVQEFFVPTYDACRYFQSQQFFRHDFVMYMGDPPFRRLQSTIRRWEFIDHDSQWSYETTDSRSSPSDSSCPFSHIVASIISVMGNFVCYQCGLHTNHSRIRWLQHLKGTHEGPYT